MSLARGALSCLLSEPRAQGPYSRRRRSTGLFHRERGGRANTGLLQDQGRCRTKSKATSPRVPLSCASPLAARAAALAVGVRALGAYADATSTRDGARRGSEHQGGL